MARSRFEKLEPGRQESILRAAADEFADRGYEAASLNRIIERSGISKGSLYYYFEDKSDLYSTVMERATELAIRLVGGFRLEEMTAAGFWPALEGFFRRSTAYLESNAWYVRLARAFYRMRGEPGGGRRTRRLFDLVRHWTRATIVRGQELGVVRVDLPLDFLVEATMALGEAGDRWLLENWEGLSERERERMIGAELSLFRGILDARPRGERT